MERVRPPGAAQIARLERRVDWWKPPPLSRIINFTLQNINYILRLSRKNPDIVQKTEIIPRFGNAPGAVALPFAGRSTVGRDSRDIKN
jgi:hypothetical protein